MIHSNFANVDFLTHEMKVERSLFNFVDEKWTLIEFRVIGPIETCRTLWNVNNSRLQLQNFLWKTFSDDLVSLHRNMTTTVMLHRVIFQNLISFLTKRILICIYKPVRLSTKPKLGLIIKSASNNAKVRKNKTLWKCLCRYFEEYAQ